tara:strand:+ start:930 stop:1274 length:345 start_codon:yes stop_codon:yes gene_type:complete
MAGDMKKETFFLISIGAIPGALFRWLIDEIFVVNLIGCFLFGFINSLNISKKYKLTIGAGLCGSMSTFSGWSFHLYKLLCQGLYNFFLVDSISIVVFAFFAMTLGHIFGKKLNL